MAQIEQILCPVDFFPASQRAAGYAIELAKAYRSRLVLLHVVEPDAGLQYEVPVNVTEVIDALTASAAEMLDRIAKRADRADVAVDVVIRTGLVDLEIQQLGYGLLYPAFAWAEGNAFPRLPTVWRSVSHNSSDNRVLFGCRRADTGTAVLHSDFVVVHWRFGRVHVGYPNRFDAPCRRPLPSDSHFSHDHR